MRIANNLMAMNAHRQLTINHSNAAKAMERLSSGFRINRAGDDAAGLAISEKMRGQVRGLKMAQKNAQDAISLIQTAEGALNETHSILQRMRELAVQAASDTNTDTDRIEIQKEVDQLAIELTRIANNTEFNTQTLLNGAIQDGALGELGFHIGANEGQFITLGIGAMDAFSLGVARDVLGAEVDDTATGINSAQVSEPAGTAIKDGATIAVSVTEHTTDAQASGAIATDVTISAVASGAYNGAAGNGIQVVISASNGATAGASLSGNTLTITLDSSAAMNTGAINAALAAGGLDADFSATGTGSVADGDNVTLSGGADAGTTTVHFGDGTNQDSVIVDPTATSVRVTSGAFQGLSFTTDDVTTVNGNINIVLDAATSASFANGQKTADAYTGGGIDVSSRAAANSAITVIQEAIDNVSAERSKLGAYQNRLEHTIANLGVSAENLQAAESRIRDVDMAKEMMEFTKYQILQQASTAMLAQANLAPQSVLQLLG